MPRKTKRKTKPKSWDLLVTFQREGTGHMGNPQERTVSLEGCAAHAVAAR
jgi:hypothetical protein